jgi:hypothetical protein
MAKIKGNNNNNILHCLWECNLVQPLWKSVWRFLKKLEIELKCDSVILLLVIYPKDHKTGYSRNTCTLMFIAALFTIAKLWKQPRCPTKKKNNTNTACTCTHLCMHSEYNACIHMCIHTHTVHT